MGIVLAYGSCERKEQMEIYFSKLSVLGHIANVKEYSVRTEDDLKQFPPCLAKAIRNGGLPLDVMAANVVNVDPAFRELCTMAKKYQIVVGASGDISDELSRVYDSVSSALHAERLWCTKKVKDAAQGLYSTEMGDPLLKN